MDVRFGGLLPYASGDGAHGSAACIAGLKALLRCAPFLDSDVVLQSQHRSLLSPGGADAKITKPTESRSIQIISSAPEAGAASRNQTETVRLLARLLREHIGRVRASGSRKEADDE